MIEADLRTRLGPFRLNARLGDSGFICLVGRNGSGKSVLMKTIAGFRAPDEGYIRVNGREVTRLPVESRGVVMVTPGSSIPHLQVDAHLMWGSKLNKVVHTSERIARVKAELGIDFTGRVSKLSLGMNERVALATALLSSPKVILVDEAFSNLHDRREFISSYRELTSRAGIDVVFSTQDEADGELAQHLYKLEDGRATKKF